MTLARRAAAESFVLLKNKNNILPLQKSASIAIVGPLGDSKANMVGTWAVATDFSKATTLLEGIKNKIENKDHVFYALGSNISDDSIFENRVNVFGKSLNRDNRNAADIIKEAVDISAKADVIIAAVGEVAEMSGESSSRSDISIPKAQRDLLNALMNTGKPVIMVLFTGRPLAIKWEAENIPAIMTVWHPGTEAGNAIADVLFGDAVPSAKLTTTWPQNMGQIPIYYAHKNTGRPLEEGKWFEKFRSNYLDVSNDPLFPFGYGLSYTSFAYTNTTLNKSVIQPNDSVEAKVTITNTGEFDGDEIVQLYTRQMVGSITRPVKELKGFQKIFLKKGEHKQVSFTISSKDLKFYNNSLKYVFEPGNYKIFIGTDSNTANAADCVFQ